MIQPQFKDNAKLDFLVYDLLLSTHFMEKLPELIGAPVSDDEWSTIIDAIERVIYLKNLNTERQVNIVGRPFHA